jgi:hypothetical protein
MRILAGPPLYKKFQMRTSHQMFTTLCGHVVLCDMRCLGGCEGLCIWSKACLNASLGALHSVPPQTVYEGIAKIGFEHLKVFRQLNTSRTWVMGCSVCASHHMQNVHH